MSTSLKDMSMKEIGGMLMSLEQFIEGFNAGEVVLLDVRFPFETELWGMKFAIEIPSNELEDRLSELPKDKVIACACPLEIRSNMVCQYLLQNGYEAKILIGGLLGLADRLRGGAANDLQPS